MSLCEGRGPTMVAGTDPTLCLTPLRLMTRTAHHNNAERYRPHQRYRWFTANPPLNIGVSAGREGGQVQPIGTPHQVSKYSQFK